MVAEPWLAYLHAPPPAPPEQPEADAPPWTSDMDDMLRITLRQRAFDFEQASAQISRYVMRVRTSGGMLPDEVNELLYTPAECRCRWAALDRQFLDAHAAFEAAERAWTEPPPPEPPPPEPPRAAWASGSAEALSGAEDGEEATDSDDEDSSAAGGIVNVEALRAQMLRKAGGGGARGVPVETAAPPRSMESVERDFYAAVGLGGSDGAPAAAAASRGTPAGHSFPMFKPPAPPPPKGDGGPARAHEAVGAAQRSEAELAALQKLAETDEEAARIVEPLTGLKARVESLQELLARTDIEASAKLAEVTGISREMAQLQELAAQLSERSAEGVVTAGGARRRQGSRATPACAPDGVDLEQALAGLDVDAMLASLEAEHQPSLDELDD